MLRWLTCLCLLGLLVTSQASADQYVRGYYRQDGRYVPGYWRSSPNWTVRDNYSYLGNINPYTGATGRDRYESSPTSAYYTPLGGAVRSRSYYPAGRSGMLRYAR